MEYVSLQLNPTRTIAHPVQVSSAANGTVVLMWSGVELPLPTAQSTPPDFQRDTVSSCKTVQARLCTLGHLLPGDFTKQTLQASSLLVRTSFPDRSCSTGLSRKTDSATGEEVHMNSPSRTENKVAVMVKSSRRPPSMTARD